MASSSTAVDPAVFLALPLIGAALRALYKRKRASVLAAVAASAIGKPPTPREVPGKVFYDANTPMDAEGRVHHLHVKAGDGAFGRARGPAMATRAGASRLPRRIVACLAGVEAAAACAASSSPALQPVGSPPAARHGPI